MGWNVLIQRITRMRYRLAILLAYTLLACTFVACSSGGAPQAGSSSNKCDAPAPSPDNVRAQADNCGVSGLEIVRKDALPKTPNVGIVTIDLYIEQHDVCAIVNVFCLLGDNRQFVPSGQPDPKADYSRNRAHMILDFRTGQLTLIVNPSCRIHPLGVGWDPNKECFAPHSEGSGTDLKLNVTSDGTVNVEVTLHQSDYPSGGFCDLYNHFSILPHNDAGTFDLTGEGSGFPDLAVIQDGQVVYADQGTHATELCFSPVHKRTYNYPSLLSTGQNLSGQVLVATMTTPILNDLGKPALPHCLGPRNGNGALLFKGWDVVALGTTPSYEQNGHQYLYVTYPDPCQPGFDFSHNDKVADGSGAVGYIASDALAEVVAVLPNPTFGFPAWRDCWDPTSCGDATYPNSFDVLKSRDGPVLYAWWTGSYWDPHWWHVLDKQGNEAAVYGRDWTASDVARPRTPYNEGGHVLRVTTPTKILNAQGNPINVRCIGPISGGSAIVPATWNVVALQDKPAYQLNGKDYLLVAYPDPCEPGGFGFSGNEVGDDFSPNDAIVDQSGAVGYVAFSDLAETNAAKPDKSSPAWRDCWDPTSCGDATYPNSFDVLKSRDGPMLYAWWTGSYWDPHWWHVLDKQGNEAAVYGRDWIAIG